MSADEILSIDPERYKTNADLIMAAAEMGWLAGTVIDLTYGPGKFWTKYQPKTLVTNDLDQKFDTTFHHDARNLPFEWTMHFDSSVIDLPYKLDGTPQDRGPGEANLLYGVSAGARPYESVDAVGALYRDAYDEAHRITKRGGYILVKVMDQVSGAKTRWFWDLVHDHARDKHGDRHVGDFYLIGSRKQPDGRRQVNIRNNYSILMVLERGRK
jgi:hypothetical protein